MPDLPRDGEPGLRTGDRGDAGASRSLPPRASRGSLSGATRAQSEVLGFVLVFGLMVSMIGVVYVTGFDGLRETRDVEQVDNAQRAFEVLATNIEDMTFRNAPRRATEIRLNRASLSLGDPTEINVSDPDGTLNMTVSGKPIVYTADAGMVVYEQGAVIRQRDDTDGGVVIHESTVVMNENRTIIPVIQTRLSTRSKASQGGTATVLVRAVEADTAVRYSNTTAANTIWLNITSPRAQAWKRYLDAKPDVTCRLSAPEKTDCSVTTDRTYVSTIKVDIGIE